MVPRGTATDKLAKIVQVLQTARKTGLLSVQRDSIDNFPEQGTITLQNGQVIDASLGQLRGVQAFNNLMTWRNCYFIFQAAPPNKPLLNSKATGYAYEMEAADRYISTRGVPYRIKQVNEILPFFDRLGLTRTHRQLFLLIDGRRTVQELMQLMGHRVNNLDTLLADLERAGLIRQ